MLDEFAQSLILEASSPTGLSNTSKRDIISQTYFMWLSQNVFNDENRGGESLKDELRRLSLASSILHEIDNTNNSSIDATAFLIAEAAEISSLFSRSNEGESLVNTRFRRAVRYLDLASHYHLADYDANANVMAKKALGILAGEDFNVNRFIDDSRLSYYRCIGYFLRGKFADCQDEARREIQNSSAEERGFLFLRRCLINLIEKYKGQGSIEVEARLNNLYSALQDNLIPYFSLRAEVHKLIAFSAAVSRKSLYLRLQSEFSNQQEYLHLRIRSDNNRGYPFAWPPTRSFCEEYFQTDFPHAVITIPTGAGKSFLAELASVDALRHGWVLYMAPTNALCSQIKSDLNTNLASLSNVGVEAFLGELEYLEELPEFQIPRQVLVVTPEKALLLLKRTPEIFKECSAVILDECHLLGSKHRGDIAEIVIAFCLSQNTNVRIVLMSALIQDSEKLANWLEIKTGKRVARIDDIWRPTRIARLTVMPDWSTLKKPTQKGGKYSINVRVFGDTVTPWSENTPLESWSTPIRLEHENEQFGWINDVSRELAAQFVNENIPTLVFVLKNRHHAFSIAEKYRPISLLIQRPPESQREYDLATLAAYEIGTLTIVKQLIDEKGAAVHTSTMLNCERELSEIAFARGRSMLLVATGTLSQGLNLAAKAVIVAGTKLSEFGNGLNNDPEELQNRSLTQVLNASGRAARANIACRGTSVIVPDTLPRYVDKNTTKKTVMQLVPELRYKDASLAVNSPIAAKFQAVLLSSNGDEAKEAERNLLALLPIESESMAAAINFSLGSYEITANEGIKTIINRLESIKLQAIEGGIKGWVLKSASLAGIEYIVANDLYTYIVNEGNKTDYAPPEDSYKGWAFFLLSWLEQLPAHDTVDLLRLHIKAWRYYWGKEKDVDLINLFEKEGYPEKVTETAKAHVSDLWTNIRNVVDAWLSDETLLQIGTKLTRRESPKNRQISRSSPGHNIPRTIMWTKGFIERLAQYGGLLLALQNQWLENESNSIPSWLKNVSVLQTFPVGLRYGVIDPFSAAWYRHVIQERRAANLLQSIAPLELERLLDLQEAWTSTQNSLSTFLLTEERNEEINVVLRRLLHYDNPAS
jgi:hypothetical protein